MDTFDINRPLEPGITLLEASAGTGKTWTIAALITKHVADGTVGLEEMLVVTFTRAASQELRERVRAQLVDAERSLDACVRGAPPDDPDALVALLCAPDPDDPAELGRRLERLRLALTDFDAATAPALQARLAELVAASTARHIVLNIAAVDFCDSAAVRAFAAAHRAAAARGATFRLDQPRPHIAWLLRTLHADHLLDPPVARTQLSQRTGDPGE